MEDDEPDALPIHNGEELAQQQIDGGNRSTLPTVSPPRYRMDYHDLQDYREALILTRPTTTKHVFAVMANKHAHHEWVSPKTLWTKYSMIKAMVRIREGSQLNDGQSYPCET